MKGHDSVEVRTGFVAAARDLFGHLHRGDVDDAFAGLIQQPEGIIPVADNATWQWWLKFHHRVPRHCHDVRAFAGGSCQQDDRSRFELAVDFQQR